MRKSVKITLGAIAAFLCCACVGAAAVIYFAVSFYQAQRLFNEGALAMNQRDYETAIAKFNGALGKHLDRTYRAYALGDLAFCEYSNGRCDDAVRDYTEALKLDPKLAWAYENRGLLRDESAETDQALQDFAEAIRLDPNSYHAHFSRGLIEMERKDPQGAIEDFSEAARIDPSSPAAYYNRGIAYSSKKDYDRALANFDAAIQINPTYATALAERGYVYLQKNELEKAIADLSASIRLRPGHQSTYRIRGFAFRDQKRWNEAISDFNKALHLNPKDIAALDGRASTYSQMGDQDRAITDFTAVLQDWDLPDVYYRRGSAYSRKGNYDRANLDLREAVKQAPEDEFALNNFAWFLATCPDGKFRNGNEAVANAMKACVVSRWRYAYHIDTLAAAYAEAGRFNEAIAYQIKAMSYDALDPGRLDEMDKRRALYEQHKPYRQTLSQ
jgi:tetratricopeptide (TPR) repeat protein